MMVDIAFEECAQMPWGASQLAINNGAPTLYLIDMSPASTKRRALTQTV
jgi:hypothetical protein